MRKMKRHEDWTDAKKLYLIIQISAFHTHDTDRGRLKGAIHMMSTIATASSDFINTLIERGDLDDYVSQD